MSSSRSAVHDTAAGHEARIALLGGERLEQAEVHQSDVPFPPPQIGQDALEQLGAVEDYQQLGFTEAEQRELFHTHALQLLGMKPEGE